MLLPCERLEKLKKFVSAFGLEFNDMELLNRAFVHSSYVNENNLDFCECYERLEFLGDAVLKIIISDFLFKTFPDAREGELTNIRSTVVSDKELAVFAKKINLSDVILLGPNEEKSKGREKASILACAFEAFLGAVYIDYKALGLKAAYDFMIDNFMEDILNVKSSNYKALLQEYTQGIDHCLPVYRVINESGLSHDKTYETGVYYHDNLIAKGLGKSKKEAEQAAAFEALKYFNVEIV